MKEVIMESNGTHKGEPIYCTVNAWDCPYYKNGICYIKDPMKECDDFSAFFDSWEDWEECDEEN